MITLKSAERIGTTELLARRKSRLPAWVFVVGCVVSLAFWYVVNRQVKAGEYLRFERLVDQVRTTIQSRLHRYHQVSTALSGLFAARVPVDRTVWTQYAASLDLQDYPGAIGFEFVRYVPRGELETFLARTRREGAPDFEVRTEGDQKELFVVEYVEPLGPNAGAVGLDLHTDRVKRDAAMTSVARGVPTLSKRVRLVQDAESVAACLLLQPVFRPGMPVQTSVQRWKALEGWVCIPIRVRELLDGLVDSAGGQVDFEVFEGDAAQRANLLYDADNHLLASTNAIVELSEFKDRLYHRQISLDATGQLWKVRVSSGASFERFASRVLPSWVLIVGLVSTVCASLVVRMLGRSRQRAIRLARDMTFELRREIAVRAHATQTLHELTRFQQAMFESAGHAIISTDRAGLIRTFNPAAQRLLGYKDYEVIGQQKLTLFHDAREIARRSGEFGAELSTTVDSAFEVLVVKSLRGVSNEHEWTYLAKDGRRLHVMLTVSALTDETGAVTGFLAMAIDITERNLAQRRLALFVEHAPAAVAMFDLEMRYLAVSHRWLKQYGLQNRSVIGLSHYDVLPQLPERWKEVHRRCLAGAVETCDDDHWRPAGWERDQFLRWEARPWYASDGQVGGLMMYVQDITSEREHERELIRLHDAAEAASLAKSNFLAAMSHEIRTPMNGVLGFANLLLDTELTEEQRGFVQTITTSGQSLLSLINDILDYSKIEAGRIELENHSFDLEQVVIETVELLSTSAENKSLPLALHYAPDAPRAIVGDPGRVRQVLLNLLGNAIKFTSEGHVLVTVERAGNRMNGEDWSGVRLSVSDTGIGIAESKIGLLFNKFTQADASTARKYGGTGLGLAISRQLVELMGGDIGVQSEESKGSTFWFSLPVPVGSTPVVSDTPMKTFEGIRVMVVDDSEINRRVLHHQLVQWGIDHDVVASGPAALLAMRQAWVCGRPFQVALVDHFMPEMSGEELGRRISADPDLNKTALILLTSAAQRRDATWISEAGFQACFMKPIVRMNALLEALSNAIVPFKDPFARLNTPPTREVAPARSFDLARPVSGRSKNPEAKYKVLLVEDNLVNQKLAVLMLQRLGCGVDLALNGRVGYEMANRAKYDLVFMDCHMPEMDGFEATRMIREKQPRDPMNAKSLVVVALTASVLPEDQQRCFDAGMDDFITKPLKSSDLQAVIRRWLETNEGREAMVARGGSPQATFRASLPTPV